jgi:ADP-ribosyl-[dinitrogen reductase] hydrolase
MTSRARDATTLPTRLVGGVWGHLVGDAAGVPYEFRPASAVGEIRFGAAGTHGQPPGTWSDDGALMLALLDSLLSVGFDVEDQGQRALAWWRDGAYTPDPGRPPFDVGGTTGRALQAIADGVPAVDAGPSGELDCGNGSLMRILPIALVGDGARNGEGSQLDTATLIERASRASRVTHGHPRARAACSLYVLVAARLLDGERDRDAAFATATRDVQASIDGDRPMLAALYHLLGHVEREGRGRVWDSFLSAWDAFAGAGSYREAIERAIAYGNDTDTTAAIAGGLAGVYWGIDGIPAEWLAGMRGRGVVEPLVDRLVGRWVA